MPIDLERNQINTTVHSELIKKYSSWIIMLRTMLIIIMLYRNLL